MIKKNNEISLTGYNGLVGSKKKRNFKLQKKYSHYINYFYYKIFGPINNFF